jgi:hypothetical protein
MREHCGLTICDRPASSNPEANLLPSDYFLDVGACFSPCHKKGKIMKKSMKTKALEV